MSETPKCELCGEPMPVGEKMFKFHGYSGDCPKSPLPHPIPAAPASSADYPTIRRLADPAQTTVGYQGPMLVEEAVDCLRQLDAARAENEVLRDRIISLKQGLAEALGGWGQWLVNYPNRIEKDKLNRLYDLLKDAP